MLKKVLIANRGEIAVRIIRSCRELNIPCVSVFSDADRNSLHVRSADEAYCIGPPPARSSYLDMDAIIETAKKANADSIHPGYGFMAENAEFARRCREAGIIFIGPAPETIAQMGDKVQARAVMKAAGVPLAPGTESPVEDLHELRRVANEIGLPIMLKSVAGGGGKGMRLIHNESDLEKSFRAARSESKSAFGSADVYVEKFIENPRHVEFQVLADSYGHTIHLCERECSIQRRHQKLIEETPSVFIDDEIRNAMSRQAVAAAQAAGYTSAGTVEFLMDRDKNFYFLEMNTRLQVEHPVTEMVTGIDLAKWQLKIAAGERLTVEQKDIRQTGHSIECRIYAEDPFNGFIPSPGRIRSFKPPGGPGVRLDHCIFSGYDVPMHYDPIIGKLIVWGRDRSEAIHRMSSALDETAIYGIKTTIPFHQRVMRHEKFLSGDFDTGFIDAALFSDPSFGMTEKHRKDAVIIAALVKHLQRGKQTTESADQTDESRWKTFYRSRNIRKV